MSQAGTWHVVVSELPAPPCAPPTLRRARVGDRVFHYLDGEAVLPRFETKLIYEPPAPAAKRWWRLWK